MSNHSREKIELLKELLKEIHKEADLKELKEKFKEVLSRISPFEILIIEQELVKEGIDIKDILSFCDLHVELFRETLLSRELRNVPKGHPIDLLIKENEWILKLAEALNLYARALMSTSDPDKAKDYVEIIVNVLNELKKIRLHYRKIQMLIFPYLERLGISAVTRVLWSREDQILVKMRSTLTDLQIEANRIDLDKLRGLTNNLMNLLNEITELVFRENKILLPAAYALLPEGAWVVISEISREIGYIIDTSALDWFSNAKPVYPYEWNPDTNSIDIGKLPEEFKSMDITRLKPDNYVIKSNDDLEFETGFLSHEEIEGIFKSLPLELTYANLDNRVKFFSESDISRGFVRTKTLIGRKIQFCHPPRLENFVMQNVNALKQGVFTFREFWTKQGNKVLRVIITPVKDRNGKLLGVLEIVEDLTNVVENPDEVKKRIMVL